MKNKHWSGEYAAPPAGMTYWAMAQWHLARLGNGPGGDSDGNTHGHAYMACINLCSRNDGSINYAAAPQEDQPLPTVPASAGTAGNG